MLRPPETSKRLVPLLALSARPLSSVDFHFRACSKSFTTVARGTSAKITESMGTANETASTTIELLSNGRVCIFWMF